MTSNASPPIRGLENVVVSDSSICFLDGEKGVLEYRGIPIQELAEHSTFEETAFLLIYGSLPTESQLAAFSQEVGKNRLIPSPLHKVLELLPGKTTPMEALRTAVSALAGSDPDAEDNSRDANLRKTIRMTAQIATIIAAHERIRKGQEPIGPRKDLSHAACFLYMLTGKEPDPASVRALDIALVLHADHEMNASTFTGRVVVSTMSDLYSAVTAAIGALKGPLHGGANHQVMGMLEAIGSVENVEPFLMEKLAAKEKIMGFGHRVYRTLDPRAEFLKKMSKELSEKVGPPKWYEISIKLQEAVWRDKKLNANVDFYSASVYRYLGIPTDLFPTLFAMSRVVGWCAHFLEQYADNRLIRPLAHYTGARDLHWIPLANRQAPSPVP